MTRPEPERWLEGALGAWDPERLLALRRELPSGSGVNRCSSSPPSRKLIARS